MTSSVPRDCPLCGRTAQVSEIPIGLDVNCEACGHSEVTGSFWKSAINADLKQRIGFWTRDQNDLGEIAKVTTYTADFVANLPEQTVDSALIAF